MTNSEKINSLKAIQKEEENNNFENGDLWNNCEDAIRAIRMTEETVTIDSRNFH